jgi:putative transposase
MPRQPRAHQVYPGLPHHVVLRGNNRRRLFSYPRDRLDLLRLVDRASSAVGVPVHAFSLVTNHGHLIATPPTVEALSEFVKRFAQSYAWRRNHALDRSGKLFEERFYCKPITSDAQYCRTSVYVDLNGMRAGLCRSPEQHRWCSYRLHTRGTDPLLPEGLWTPHPWWLALGRDDASRGRAYQTIVEGLAHQAVGAELDHHVVVAERAIVSQIPDRRPDGSRVAEPTVAYQRLGKTAADLE